MRDFVKTGTGHFDSLRGVDHARFIVGPWSMGFVLFAADVTA